MKKLAFLTALAISVSPAIANNYDTRWYVTPSMNFTNPDSEKNLDGDFGYGLAIGKFLTEKWSLDLEGNVGVLDYPGEGHVSHTGIGLMGRYHFGGYETLKPYVGVGLGMIDHNGWEGIGNKVDSSDWMLNLGLGLRKKLTNRLGLQAEVQYRLDTDDYTGTSSSYDDFLFVMGMNIALGASQEVVEEEAELVEPAPQLDSDKDGVSDANDDCPNTPMGARVDSRGCQIVADGDGDNDGVKDSMDACPNSKPGAVVDNRGCDVQVVIELQGVHFDYDKSTLRPESIRILDAAVRTLGEHGSILIEVAGYTDSRGSESYNQRLSQNRARVVYDYLVSRGVSADRMSWRGYGESNPVATNETEEGRAKNRRTELIIKN